MAGPGNILIKIGAEAYGALSEFDKVNGKMGETATKSQKVGAALKAAAVPATIALGAIAVGAKKAIDAASDLEKQVQKTSAVFGPSAKAIVAWSEGLAKSFGLSSGEALDMANRFGNLFVNLGYSQKQAAGMSEQMVQLAADMASFNHVPVSETMAALQSGLAGATRGLKKYGIVIDSSALKQEALKEGLYSGKGALDAHAKAAASLTLIMHQTANAQGDFAKHSHDAANAQAIQAAETKNMEEELGKGLLPYYEAALGLLIKLTDVMGKHTTTIKVVIGAIAALSAAILVANAAWKAYTIAQNVAKVATVAFSAANRAMMLSLATNPVFLIIAAIVALGVAFVVAYQKSATFRSIVHGALSAVEAAATSLGHAFTVVKNAAVAAFDWIIAHWKLGAFALGPLGVGIVELVTHFNKVEHAGTAAFNAIAGPIHTVLNAINGVISAVQSLISWLGKIKVPKISLPHIPGLNSLAYYYPAPASAMARGGYAGAVTPAATLGAGVTVNFYGPTDPEGAARAIAKVLRAHDRRQGRL